MALDFFPHTPTRELESIMAEKSDRARKLSPEDWIDALIAGLLEEGPKGTRITRLARRLGVTPGSFYWHFRDRDFLRDKALEHWRTRMLRGATAALQLSTRPADRLRALPDFLVDRGLPDLDAAMRAWAIDDGRVAEAVAKADEMRKRMLTELLEGAGVHPEDAALRAQVFFWSFLGSAGVDAELRMRGLKDLIDVIAPKR
jgi:AcrR family transcriptional regulator